MTQNTETFVSLISTPNDQKTGPTSGTQPHRLSERIWQSVTTLRGRFTFFAFIIVIFAIITAATILVSALRASADLNTINKPSVDAAQIIIPYIENIDAQTANYLADTNPTDTHTCVISSIGQQQSLQQPGVSVHDCADRTIDADLQKVNDELYIAGHNVSFTGERTAIVQTELGLEEYASKINLMRSEYQQAANPSSRTDIHMQRAYQDAIAATNILHQQIIPASVSINTTEAGLPSCKLGTQTLSAQAWPDGGIEQNVGCLSAISKANLDAAYGDTVKFVGISLGLVFGLCIYSCIFIIWTTWSMASTTRRVFNLGLSLAFIAALVITGFVLSDFNTIYGYKGNFSIIQNAYGTVYNAGILEQNSADANADQAHWLLALAFKDPNANTWYNEWQTKAQALQTSLQNMKSSMQSQPIYPTLLQNWNQVDAQGKVISGELKNANGSTNTGALPQAEDTYISTETPAFQTFLYDVGLFSASYSQQYNTIFNQTGTLLLSLMTWCSATFFLLGFVAAWGILRRLPEF